MLRPRVLEPVTPMVSSRAGNKVPQTPLPSSTSASASSTYAKEWEDQNSYTPQARVVTQEMSEAAKTILKVALGGKNLDNAGTTDMFQEGRTTYIYRLSQDHRVAQVTVRSKLILQSADILSKPVLSFDVLYKVLELMRKTKRVNKQEKVVFEGVPSSQSITRKLPDFLAKIVEKTKSPSEPTKVEPSSKEDINPARTVQTEMDQEEAGGLFGYRNELPLLNRVKSDAASYDYEEDASQNDEDEDEEGEKVGKKSKKSKPSSTK